MRTPTIFLTGTVAFTLAAFSLFGVWLVKQAADEERTRISRKMQTIDRLVEAENADPLWNVDEAKVLENCKRIFSDPELVRVTVLDPASAVTVNLVNQEGMEEASETLRSEFQILREGQVLADVELVYTTALLDARLHKLNRNLLTVAAAMLLMVMGSYLFLLRGLSRPVAALRRAIREVDEGSFPTVDLQGGSDIRELGARFNTMVEGLEEIRTRDRETIRELESKTGKLGREIRERQLSEEAVRQTQKMEAVARVTGGVAADFNDLLTSILGFSAMAKDQLDENQQAFADINEVIRAAERARELTQQLLSLGRRHQLQMRQLDVSELITGMKNDLGALLGDEIELVLLPDDRVGPVLVDDVAFKQVIHNLALNARDAMQNGGKLIIEIKEVFLERHDLKHLPDMEPGSYALISMMDSGIGMTEEVKEHIFEPFYTTKGEGSLGLGLATVHGIVRQCRGALELHSDRGRGTQVLIYLPVQAVEADTTIHALASKVKGGDETLLLVENEESVRRLTRRALEEMGYDILEARHGHDGLKVALAYKDRIHLVLSDVMMPHMNGPDMVRELRQDRPGLKVLYMSGFTQDRLPEIDEEGRTVHLMLKPFTREILYRRVREVLAEEST